MSCTNTADSLVPPGRGSQLPLVTSVLLFGLIHARRHIVAILTVFFRYVVGLRSEIHLRGGWSFLLLGERGQLLDYWGCFLLSKCDVGGADAVRGANASRLSMEVLIHRRLLPDLLCIRRRKTHSLLLWCQLSDELELFLLEEGLSPHIFELVDANASLLVLLLVGLWSSNAVS